MKSVIKFTRRNFLKISSISTIASAIIPGKIMGQEKEEKINSKNILNYHPDMHYRRLGNTDIYLSVLSLGGGGLKSEVTKYAIQKGVNLIHMSQNYGKGRAIRELGKVLKTSRDKVYIAVKADFDNLDSVLETLHTDYIDFLMFPRHSEKKINNFEDIAKYEQYKQQGKVRFMGLTIHNKVKQCLSRAIQGGHYSLIMPSLNQPNLELLAEELTAAYKNNISIMAMKTLQGIKNKDLQVAFLKKLLKNPGVTTIIKGINSFKTFDLYQKAISESLSLKEDFKLYRYAQKNRSNNCMMCGECEEICPYNIEISTLLRCKYYYYDQLNELHTARMNYRNIPQRRRNTDNCNTCKKCEQYCPNGIAITSKLIETNKFFSKT